MSYMENWSKLTRSEKDTLISRYAITSTGEPPEPVSVVEYEKVPEKEWDRLIQKEVPQRKKVEKKEEPVEEPKEEEPPKKPRKVVKKPKVEKKKRRKKKK